jgi:hypothetical protein
MKRYFPILILLACVTAFAFGVVYLFQLRFESGDVYPPYSSLRADPLGSMALYESLGKISGLSVRRDFSETDRLPEEPGTVYLHLAGTRYEWEWLSPDAYRHIQDFLARDGRLVITFYPQTESYLYDAYDDETNSDGFTNNVNRKMTEPRSAKKRHTNSDDEETWISLEDEWDLHTDFSKLPRDGDSYGSVAVSRKGDLPLPQTLEWHSGIVFTNLGKSWHVIYARGTNAVVIERNFGKGSVVFATDSYFASNEAMTKDRHADLLAWFIGPNKNIVFDEAHFGILETSGVAMLMRKYRLHGLAAGLILLAGLFIWKNSTSLVPPLVEEHGDDFVMGKDSASGFVNLLRRSIAPRQLLAACFAEWKKSVAQKGKVSTSRFQQAEAIFSAENSPSGGSNSVETYRKISETLGTRNQNL